MSKRKVKSARGVEIHRTLAGTEVVYIRYQASGKAHRERIGPSMTAGAARLPGPPARNVTVEQARRTLKERRNEIRDARLAGVPWLSPRDREQDQARARLAAADAREALRFENAAERFLRECAAEYSRPEAVAATFRMDKGGRNGRPGPLAAAFAGRYLDAITRADVRQYYLDRLEQTGPFVGWGKVSRRAPEQEIAFLSALYTFLSDEGHAVDNLCHRPRTRRKEGALAPYRPTHEAVIPLSAALRAILAVDPRGPGAGRGADKPEHRLVSPQHRALWALCYYTAARPESEPCALLHGDVELGEGDRWGAVTYRETKTGGDRRVRLHPQAARLLRAAMVEEPSRFDEAAREAWRATPIFLRRGSRTRTWDTSSYRKAWAATVETVKVEHPEVEGAWLRDLRKAAKTRMIDAGVSELVVNRILGHRDGVTARCYKLSDEAMRAALEALTLESRTPARTPKAVDVAAS